jgi:hypothetical protein
MEAMNVGEQKYWEPNTVRSRHMAIMDLMLARPDMNQNEIAERLNYTPSRLSIIVNSPLFKLAFAQYRTKFENELSTNLVDLITDATKEAVQFSRDVVKDTGVPINLRQTSARDILNQGHVKAAVSMQVDRRSSEVRLDIPFEALASLREVILEAKKPVDVGRRTFRPPVEDDNQPEGPTAT